MKAVKDLCIRLINRKTYSKEEITDMVTNYKNNSRLTESEYAEVMELIESVYAE